MENDFDFNTTTIVSNYSVSTGPQFPKTMLGFTAACAFIIAIFGTFGNLLTIVALTMSRKLRTCATAYVVNLAVVELLFCVFILPMSGAQYAYLQYFNAPLLSDRDCVFFALTRYTLTQVELQTVVGISLTRAVAVGCTNLYHKMNTKTFTGVYITLIWIYSFLLKLPTGLGVFGSYVFNNSTMECDHSTDIMSLKSRFVALWLEAFIPVILVLFLYIFIFIMVLRRSIYRAKNLRKNSGGKIISVRKSSLRVSRASVKGSKGTSKSTSSTATDELSEGEVNNARKGSSSSFKSMKRLLSSTSLNSRFTRRSSSISTCIATNRRDIRLARTIFTIFLMILVCSVPVGVVHFIDSKGKKPIRFLGVHILYWLQYCLNLVVYVLMNKQYRDAYIECLSKVIPGWERHKGFTFPWETPSTSIKVGFNSSIKNRMESASMEPNPEEDNGVTSKHGRLSAIPEINSSSCVSDDDVFQDGDDVGTTRANIPYAKKREDHEDKEHWISKTGEHTPAPEGDVVV